MRMGVRSCLVGLIVALLAIFFPYIHITLELAVAANLRGYGAATASADWLKTIYPYAFDRTVTLLRKGQSTKNDYAEKYYHMERPNILANLATFTLHPYFANPNVPNTTSWHGLIHERMRHFRKQLDSTGAIDYYIEKDRCEMYRFYGRHSLPILPQHGMWHTLGELQAAVLDGSAFANVTAWPVFWKACHLTQSSSFATRAMSAKPTPDEAAELSEWLAAKWTFRANDYERVWVEDGNAITAGIPPGFMLQAPFGIGAQSFAVSGRVSVGIPEVRVEVLWGRPYLALLDGTTILMRNNKAQYFGSLKSMGRTPELLDDHWFFTEGHDACVWDVAARAATIGGVDSIRIDLFLNRQTPAECVLNENSLSSGMPYWGHEEFMSRLWAEPHVEKLYTKRDTTGSVLEQ